MRYQGDMAQYLDWKVFAYGCSTYCELSLLKALANEVRSRRGEVMFFDIGANIGHHTLFMAPNADHVIAFEPFADNRKLIEQKVAMNRLNNVQILPYALGAKDEKLQYYPGGAVNSGTGTFMPIAHRHLSRTDRNSGPKWRWTMPGIQLAQGRPDEG